MMEEGTEKKEGFENHQQQEEIYSKVVRAGKRTYFFDVKATRNDDYYLTITESKKRFNRDGKSFYEKHKVFLYKEDFDKFADALTETVEYIKENRPEPVEREPRKPAERQDEEKETALTENYTNVEFDDLEDRKE